MKALYCVVTGLLIALFASNVKSQTTAGDEAKAWQDAQRAATPIPVPWSADKYSTNKYTSAEFDRYCKRVFAAATIAEKKTRAFYTEFPNSTNVIAARILECRLLYRMFHMGGGSVASYEAWLNAENALVAAPGLTEDERFDERVRIVRNKGVDPGIKTWQSRNAQYENDIRQLIKDFPRRDEPYDMMVTLGAESPDDKARAIATEVLADPISNSIRDEANGILNRLNAVGKPLDIKFTALDGREVDLSQMKGKVVLIDFWATWCGPCVGEIPHVKEAYDKFHSKGFEVVGISFDSDQNKLQSFVEQHDMPWPQYFDGKTWQNKIGVQYAIESIPTMWLVDKGGNLCDTHARNDLQDRVEKLLAE